MGKKMPKQHEIDRHAVRTFTKSLPDDWIFRNQSEDYGIDGEVEVFDQGESTGVLFKVQIKGTEKPSFINDGETISFSLDMDDLDYLCQQLRKTVFLIVVDTAREVIYWHPMQLDSDLEIRHQEAKKAGQKNLTIHIPTVNRLVSKNLSLMLQQVAETDTLLSGRIIAQSDSTILINAVAAEPNIDELLKGLRRGVNFSQLEQLERFRRNEQHEEIKEGIREILEDKHASVKIKFSAWFYAELEANRDIRLADRLSDLPKVRIRIAKEMKNISRKGPLYLKAFAAVAYRAAQLGVLTERDFHLFLNSEIQRAAAERDQQAPLWQAMLPAVRTESAKQVQDKFVQCHSLLEFVLDNNFYSVFPQSVLRVVMGMRQFMRRLWAEKMFQAAFVFQQTLRSMVESALAVAIELQNWGDAKQLILEGAILGDIPKKQAVDEAKEWVDKKVQMIVDKGERESLEATMSEVFRDLAKPVPEMTFEAEKMIAAQQAEALGVNLDDPADPIADVIRIGIKDLDPSRVLKECRFLYMALGSVGLPAQMIGLPTAGGKSLFCTKHDHGMGGMSLDNIYGLFSEEYCKDCSDRQSHEDEWSWSREWQEEQYKIHGAKYISIT